MTSRHVTVWYRPDADSRSSASNFGAVSGAEPAGFWCSTLTTQEAHSMNTEYRARCQKTLLHVQALA